MFYVGQYSMQITAWGGSGFRANQQQDLCGIQATDSFHSQTTIENPEPAFVIYDARDNYRFDKTDSGDGSQNLQELPARYDIIRQMP
ncbi:hypothetical protein [Paraburkholderia nemoris]